MKDSDKTDIGDGSVTLFYWENKIEKKCYQSNM